MASCASDVKYCIHTTCGDGRRCAPVADYREGTHASRQTPHAKAARGRQNGSRHAIMTPPRLRSGDLVAGRARSRGAAEENNQGRKPLVTATTRR